MIESIVDRIFSISRKYKDTFKDADVVLYDLAKFCGAKQLPATKDSLEMARAMGRLDVYQHICKMLNMDEVDKIALIHKMQALEEQQKINEGIING